MSFTPPKTGNKPALQGGPSPEEVALARLKEFKGKFRGGAQGNLLQGGAGSGSQPLLGQATLLSGR